MMKAIFFDLDGTLLPLQTEKFLEQYFGRMAPFFGHLIEPKLFIKELLSATEAMMKNPGLLTNEEVFMKNFLLAVKQEREVMYPLFEQFYQEEFPKIKEHVGYSILAAEIVGQAVKKGYKIVLATNPLFPKMATEHRMDWAGVKEFSWEIVTTYEICNSCKPNPNYFQNLCNQIQVAPEHCLMVGNDMQEDMVASVLGMKTFLVTDHLIDREEPRYVVDRQGSLEELYKFILSLPKAG